MDANRPFCGHALGLENRPTKGQAKRRSCKTGRHRVFLRSVGHFNVIGIARDYRVQNSVYYVISFNRKTADQFQTRINVHGRFSA